MIYQAFIMNSERLVQGLLTGKLAQVRNCQLYFSIHNIGKKKLLQIINLDHIYNDYFMQKLDSEL